MPQKGKIPQDIREANLSLVFALIKSRGALSCSEIAKEVSLSNAAVEKIVDSLSCGGWLKIEEISYEKKRGRRPIKYNICGNKGLVAAVNFTDDIYTVLDITGKPILVKEIGKTDFYTEKETRALAVQIAREASAVGIPLISTGISFIGKTDSLTGSVRLSHKFESGLMIAKIFEEELGVPCLVTNDTYLPLIAETYKKQLKNAMYVYFGRGISCGFCLGGEIYSGSNGLAGELGSLMSDTPGKTFEELLAKDALKEIDELYQTDAERAFALLCDKGLPLLKQIARTALMLDISHILIGCRYENTAKLIMRAVGSETAKFPSAAPHISEADRGGIDEGLIHSSLMFAYKTIIASRVPGNNGR